MDDNPTTAKRKRDGNGPTLSSPRMLGHGYYSESFSSEGASPTGEQEGGPVHWRRPYIITETVSDMSLFHMLDYLPKQQVDESFLASLMEGLQCKFSHFFFPVSRYESQPQSLLILKPCPILFQLTHRLSYTEPENPHRFTQDPRTLSRRHPKTPQIRIPQPRTLENLPKTPPRPNPRLPPHLGLPSFQPAYQRRYRGISGTWRRESKQHSWYSALDIVVRQFNVHFQCSRKLHPPSADLPGAEEPYEY